MSDIDVQLLAALPRDHCLASEFQNVIIWPAVQTLTTGCMHFGTSKHLAINAGYTVVTRMVLHMVLQ